MTNDRPSDTSPSAAELRRALITGLDPAERVLRALALSALVRQVAWAGARHAAGDGGPDAVRQRFLEQVYGNAVATRVRTHLGREAGGGGEG